MRVPILSIVLMTLLLNPAFGAAWFKLGDSEFSARQLITLTNPSEANDPAVSVHLKLAELGEAMPEAAKETIAVADETHTIVPFQVSGGELIFVVPVKARQTKKVYVYAAKQPVQVPRFQPMTGTDSREAWRSFENEFTGFRIEVSDKAKTTGLALDIFGKTREGRGAQLQNIYASDYHKRQPWGIDVMKVGKGPGLGGVYLSLGENVGRTAAETTHFEVRYEGPVETSVLARGPVEIAGKKFQVIRIIDMRAGDRSLLDSVIVEGDADDLKDLKIGIGLRNLPNQQVIAKTDAGYAIVAGDGNQEGTEKLGLGVAFDPSVFSAPPVELASEADGGVVYYLTPHSDHDDGKSVHVHDRLAAYWDGDGWIRTPAEFEAFMVQCAQLLKTTAQIEVAQNAEKRQ